MRTIVLLALILMGCGPFPVPVMPTPSQAESPLVAGMQDGRIAGDLDPSGNWTGRGVLAGVTLGLIGTGIGYGIAGSSGVVVPDSAALRGGDYFAGFSQTFTQRVRDRRKGSVLGGGLVGSVVAGVVWTLYLRESSEEEDSGGTIITFSIAH